MSFILQPWQLLLAILSGWIHHRQQKMIEFQNDQIESLLKQMSKKRILLTDGQIATPRESWPHELRLFPRSRYVLGLRFTLNSC